MDLDSIHNWSKANNLFLNTNKCSIISFTKSGKSTHYNYLINQQSVNRVDKVKDLGIIFNGNLSFRDHLTYAVSKALRCTGFVTRTTHDFHNVNAIWLPIQISGVACFVIRISYLVPLFKTGQTTSRNPAT